MREVDETPSGALSLGTFDIHLAQRGFIQAREPCVLKPPCTLRRMVWCVHGGKSRVYVVV